MKSIVTPTGRSDAPWRSGTASGVKGYNRFHAAGRLPILLEDCQLLVVRCPLMNGRGRTSHRQLTMDYRPTDDKYDLTKRRSDRCRTVGNSSLPADAQQA